VLRSIRLTGALFFLVDASSPWRIALPEGKATLLLDLPGFRPVAVVAELVKGRQVRAAAKLERVYGQVELRRGHVDRAIEAGTRARKIDPGNGTFAADLCRSLIEKKDTARAVGESTNDASAIAKNTNKK
jgi:hypothetical protein